MSRLRITVGAAVLALVTGLSAASDPVGVWNLKVRVGNVGQGVRTVLLKIDRDGSGTLTGQISDLRNDMRPIETLTFEGDVLKVQYGDYTYTLKVVGETVVGTVSNPTGQQEVTGEKQSSVLYAGDAAAPLQKEWTGVLGPKTSPPPADVKDTVGWAKPLVTSVDDVVLWSRRVRVEFTNAKAHERTLMDLVGRNVIIAGTWRTDKLEIDDIKPAPARQP